MKSLRKSLLTPLVLTLAAAAASAQPKPINPRAEQLWEQASQLPTVQALPLFLQAAKLGHPRAQATLGNIYWNGYANQPQDYQKAKYWYSLAAAQGHRSAEFNLAGIYTEGLGGTPVDLPRAAQLLIDSSNQGYAPAQEALGISYEFGEGLQRNRRSAIYWLQKAALQGDQTASQLANFLNRPNIPVFQSEAQLANYMASQMSSQSGAGHGCVPNLKWSSTGHTDVGPIVFCH